MISHTPLLPSYTQGHNAMCQVYLDTFHLLTNHSAPAMTRKGKGERVTPELTFLCPPVMNSFASRC